MATPAPSSAETRPTIAVAWVRDVGANLVEIMFGLPDGTRQRVVVPKRYVNVDAVQFIGRALAILPELHGVTL
ncbi:MAG TPA: hypothetical protein VKU86_10495 [Acidimicrobiales bacterium]|nr:hypothetical protein [Acidimicrobiales bacterium]